jgi:hypothetical protein
LNILLDRKKWLKMLVKITTGFSHLRTSDGNLFVILHIPVVKSKDIHHLFQAHPVPAPLPIYHHLYEGEKGMVLPKLDNQMIVISKEKKSKEVTFDEMIQKCVMYLGHFLCKEFQELDHELQESCLGSLFTGHWEGTHEYCHFGAYSIREFSLQISETKHIIVTANPLQSQMYCTLDQRRETRVSLSNHVFLRMYLKS